MLKHTFLHLDGVGEVTEKKLWKKGILTHNDAILDKSFSPNKILEIKDMKEKIESNDALSLYNLLPSKERWRLFSEFHHSVAYLDIETTGLYGFDDIITTIALYDGHTINYYVNGQNLNDFKNDIKKYKLLVTYNGTNFDLPFIKSFLKISMDYAHIDLRFALKSIGYSGGLKSCENQIGLIRDDSLADVDGKFAILLWKFYKKHNRKEALHTLLSYNIEDVLSLETLMHFVYDKKISNFSLSLPPIKRREQPKNIFKPNNVIIYKIKKGLNKYGYTYLTEKEEVQTIKELSQEVYRHTQKDVIYQIPNMDFFKDSNNNKNIPSKAKTPWVYIKSEKTKYPETIKGKGGKWLIFIPEDKVDIIWQIIRKSILTNKFVRHAKCSTIIKNKHSQNNKKDCVICIYTYDYTDEVDVRVIRYKLKKLGFREKLYYKTDNATREGKYNNNGKSWLYSE